MQHPVFTDCTAVVANIASHYIQEKKIRWQGDYELSYVELIERSGEQGEEQVYIVRVAPLHVHIGKTLRLVEVQPEQAIHMLTLKYEFNENFLASLDFLCADQPVRFSTDELVYVEQICRRLDQTFVMRVAPVGLHVDGNFSQIQVMDHWFIDWLPMQIAPKKQHTCLQKRLLGELPFDRESRL